MSSDGALKRISLSGVQGKSGHRNAVRPLGPALLLILLPLLFVACNNMLNPSAGWSGVVTDAGTLYFGSMEGRLVALDEQGNFLWSFPPSGEDKLMAIYSTPAVSEGRVYIADYDHRGGTGTLYAVRAESDPGGGGGELLWQQDMGGPVVGGITVADGVVLVGSSDNHLYAFDSFSGDPLSGFPFLAQGQVWSTPAVANGLVYFGSLDHNVYAVRLSDGAEFWRFETEAGVASSPLVSNGKVYIGSFDRNFYAIDAATGVENWRFTAENWFWGGAVTDDERIYAASLDGRLYALDADSGGKWWDFPTDEPIRSTPVLVEGHGIVVASGDKTVYLLDSDSGAEVWPRNVGDRVMAPLHASGQRVYLTSLGNTVWALDIPGRRHVWTIDTRTFDN